MNAVVLFSGGMDSTVCLYDALTKYSHIEALAFDYGQRHRIELEQARIIAGLAGVHYTVVQLPDIFRGDLMGEGEIIDPVVPCRNAVFLSIATAWAFPRGINHIVAGFNAADSTDFPDCRHPFVRAMETALKEGLGARVNICCPLMDLSKDRIWKKAKDLDCLGVVIEHSHTDYYGDRSERHAWGYGKLNNKASRIRASGYDEAVMKGWL